MTNRKKQGSKLGSHIAEVHNGSPLKANYPAAWHSCGSSMKTKDSLAMRAYGSGP